MVILKAKSMFSKILTWTFSLMLLFSVVSCDKDEPSSSSSSSNQGTSSQRVSKPSFDKFLSTTDRDGFSLRVRFKTGGDKESNMRATVHWKAYSSKPSSKPSKRELTKVESMRQYGAATYHNTGSKKGMTESIVFDKSHAGYSGGTYIYYYVECSNSKGSDESSVDYTIVKR